MPLSLASQTDLWRLADELKKGFGGRDTKYRDRRRVRYRRMEKELRALPLNPTIADTALMVYQSELANQEVHKRVKRLVANPVRFEVIIYDDDGDVQRLGQELEDGVKALYRWMNRGKVPWETKVTQHQQGDGVGIGKLNFIPGHGDVLAYYDPDDLERDDEDDAEEGVADDEREKRRRRNQSRKEYRDARVKYKADDNDRDAKAYNDITESMLRRELPPFRMTAPDPTTCYWWEDDDERIEVIAEIGWKPLNPLLAVFKSYGVKLLDGKRLAVDPGNTDVAGPTAPDAAGMSRDLSQQVKYIELRTRDEIAILIEHPKITEKGRKTGGDDRGVVLRFSNPFGPYTTGYVLVPGDVTTEADEADKYQPPALGTIVGTEKMNVLLTARMSAAMEAALAPRYVKVSPETPLPPESQDKTPEVKEGSDVPMIPGEIKRVESPTVDLDKADQRIVADMAESRFQEVLEGESSAEATGHRLALQVGQADLQMVPYQNARKKAIEELMMGILYAVRKHGLTIYIPTIPDGPRSGEGLRVAERAKLTPEMADLNFELIATVGSDTALGRYAKWQALSQREQEGTLGYQTLIESSDIENPEDEIARVVEGKLFKGVLDGVLPFLVEDMREAIRRRLFGLPTPEEEAQAQAAAEAEQAAMGAPPETGLAGGGGGSNPLAPANVVRQPGVNMPVVQTTGEFGPNVPEGV